MRLFTSAVVILTLAALSPAQEPQRDRETFSITGYVIDTDGHLIASAEVHASPADRGGLQMQALTTAVRFNLSVSEPGRYWVFSFKNNKGYTEISEALIRLDPEGIPTVTVTERSPRSATVIRLRPGAARLTLRFVDSVTGRPLEKAQLVLRRENSPNNQYVRALNPLGKNGEIKLLLPSFPLTIEASAPGYESWSYSETTSTLSLAPNETREITVALRPTRKAR